MVKFLLQLGRVNQKYFEGRWGKENTVLIKNKSVPFPCSLRVAPRAGAWIETRKADAIMNAKAYLLGIPYAQKDK